MAIIWKRPPGRPRRPWLQQVEEDIGLSVGAAQIIWPSIQQLQYISVALGNLDF